MPVLSKDVKIAVVRALAEFDTPTIVQRMLKTVYDLDVPVNQIVAYNPTTYQGRALSKSLRRVFDDARKNFLDGVESIGISNETQRLKLVDEAANAARENGDTKGMIRAAEAADRIRGGHWKQKSAVASSGPIVVFNAPQVPDGVDASAAINCNQLQSPAEGSGDA
ncbi:DUF2280 domain-containing protein [Caballeronia sp. ATUFL_M2_KS44]|uniref:DUF2280 domain-containing protein n=1 Tax=Caballeronia sp. ATUFL_M2_KS44 TaxID=2921767 RepID=UPI002028747A|nr:DUF2280 domain-containing protein [Caballeronia sp. ATUFL_M2_KS44]